MVCKSHFKHWVAATVLGFLVGWGYDYFVHGVLLMQSYVDTASLWRSEAQMKELAPLCMGIGFAVTALIAMMYFCWRSNVSCGAVGSSSCPYRKSMGFGALIGTILGLIDAKAYVWLPIPGTLALSWLAAEIIKWTIIGIVFEIVHAKLPHSNA